MPTEWAKKESCWEAFKTALPALPEPLPAELAQQHGGASTPASQTESGGPILTAEDLMLISRAREIDATKWLQIAAWAKRNRGTFKLAGIASTIADYAADGWVRSPSVKQAKWGLELARQPRKRPPSDLRHWRCASARPASLRIDQVGFSQLLAFGHWATVRTAV